MDSSSGSSEEICFDNRLDYSVNYFTVEFDRYWPYGLNINEPENSNLLYIKTIGVCRNMICRFCDNKEKEKKSYIELNPKLRYSNSISVDEVELSEHPKAYGAFVDRCPPKEQKYVSILQILRPKSCDTDCLTIALIEKSIIEFSTLFQYFWKDNEIIVYLKLDPMSKLKIPRNLSSSLKFNQMLKSTYLNGFPDITKNFDLKDTYDFAEAEIPSGFNLKLRDYQLRSISWMKEIESVESLKSNTIFHDATLGEKDEVTRLKFKLGHSSYYVGFTEHEMISESPEVIQNFKLLRIGSGILADDTGSGKTITTLGLIHSNPYTHEKDDERQNLFDDINVFVQSRASCVICPENIQIQWIEEAKRCNPDFKIIGIATDSDYKNVLNYQIEIADLVVISYNFLLSLNATHQQRQQRSSNNVDLLRVHFYRIIFDELHELVMANTGCKSIVKKMRADHYWGLTGTPNLTHLATVMPFFKFSVRLENVVADNINGHNEFLKKFAKRNEPNLQLPPLINEIVWVNLTPEERVLHQLKSDNESMRTRIMMCSHYQLTGKTMEGDSFMTLKDVQNLMSESKKTEIDALEKEILVEVESIKKLREDPKIEIYVNVIESQETKLKQLMKAFNESQRKLNYFQSVFKVLGEPDGNECRICYDTIPSESLSILPCSHAFCFECVSAVVCNKNLICPLCREPLRNKSEIYRIKLKAQKQKALSGKLASLDTSKYSSKLIALYTYLTELIESDSEAKVILFLQYSELANFIDQTLKELDVQAVRVSGDVLQRQDAIKKFTESAEVRLIMLSSEDSVSGINLTQATHVILLHPFHSGRGEDVDLAFEKQGISRAYRFGLKNPLKVVRFAVKDTIEEKITLNRRDIKL